MKNANSTDGLDFLEGPREYDVIFLMFQNIYIFLDTRLGWWLSDRGVLFHEALAMFDDRVKHQFFQGYDAAWRLIGNFSSFAGWRYTSFDTGVCPIYKGRVETYIGYFP